MFNPSLPAVQKRETSQLRLGLSRRLMPKAISESTYYFNSLIILNLLQNLMHFKLTPFLNSVAVMNAAELILILIATSKFE